MKLGVSLIILSMVALAIIILIGLPKPQNATKSKADSGLTKYEETDSKFSYHVTPSCWFSKTVSGNTYKQANHASSTNPNCLPISQEWATFSTTGTGIKFDQISVGYGAWSYGNKIQAVLDGNNLAQFDTNSSATGQNMTSQKWTSDTFSCGEHSLELHPIQNSNGALTLDLDYVEIHVCSGSGGGTTSTNCQGNGNASAKCFDCYKDSSNDQINMLDYACFVKYYGQTVGKP